MYTEPNATSILPTQSNIVAVFAFDGTLTTKQSIWRFLYHVVGPWRFFTTLIILAPMFLRLALHKMNAVQLCQLLPYYFLKGEAENKIKRVSRRFVNRSLPACMNTKALRQLDWHQKQGHTTILVGDAPECYLTPWGQEKGFDYIAGSQFEILNGHLTGHLTTQNCNAEEKVNRLIKILGNLQQYRIYTYASGLANQSLLSIANQPPKQD